MLISQVIKGSKEKFFIKQNFRRKYQTSSSGQKFFGKKCYKMVKKKKKKKKKQMLNGKSEYIGPLTFYGPNSFFRRFSGHNLR